MRGQCDRLMDMVRPYGNTNLIIYFNYYDMDEQTEGYEYDFLCINIDNSDFIEPDDILEKIDNWYMRYGHTLNERVRFESIKFSFSNKDIYNEDWDILFKPS